VIETGEQLGVLSVSTRMSDDQFRPAQGASIPAHVPGRSGASSSSWVARAWLSAGNRPPHGETGTAGKRLPERTTTAPGGRERRTPNAAPQTGKLAELDGLRGIAALIVVVWHFAFGFLPEWIGIVPNFDPAAGLVGSPAFALIDGPGAVMLFFVLSGYVLPLGYFRSGRIDVVLRAVAKRWFRLVGLTVTAAVASYLLFRFGLYHYREAASFTQSDWLASFGGGDPGGQLEPSLLGAVLEGSVFAFLRNADRYDPVLWTMRDELFGSFLTFGLGLLVSRCRGAVGILLLMIVAAATQWVNPRLVAFVAGLALSWANARGVLTIHRWVAPVCLVLGAILFGYLEPRGLYAPLGFLSDASGWRYDRIWLHTLGGVLLIVGLLGSDLAGRLLASAAGRLLGRLSFPVYLFHFPLLCSLSCWLFLVVRPALPHAAALAVAALGTVPALLAVGYAFARVDEIWLAQVNRVARRVIVVPGPG
jgi:peptidoglycan/LPS O-acetylase OafA/YrhL